MGLYEIKDELIGNITEADKQFSNPLLNKVITYQNEKGEQKKAPIGNLLRLAADHPGRKAAEAMLPKDGTPERKELNKSLGSEKDGRSVPTANNTKKAGEEPPKAKDGEDGGEQKPEPQPHIMFTKDSDPAMAARMDTEKQTLDKLAKTDKPDEPIEKDTKKGELPVRQQNVDIAKSLKDRKSDEGNTLDAETTDIGSILIGVEHGKGNPSNQQAIQAIQELPSDTKVMFVGEGGTDRDKKGRIRFYGEQNEFRNAVMNHFDDADESSWDENADVNDDQSPVFDEVSKSLGGSKSKAKAAIWSNMVGQGDDLDADDYLDEEGKQWLIDQAKAGGSEEIDDFTDFNNLSDRQKEDLYQLNYRDDSKYKETEISKAQSEYNNFRQKELDRKIKEAEDKGYTVIAPMGNSHVDLWRQRNKGVEVDSEFKPVEPTDVTKEMPKADSAAFSGQSDIDKITPEEQREISMKIDELNKMTQDAMARGEKAPNYNLCQITVPGTNLYCDNNLGIPREDMPQFKGKPQPGTPAADMPVDKNGEVDTEPLFKQMLADKGVKVLDTEIPSDSLKATQSELVGSKVAGMTKALEKDPNHPAITAPIYVSRDGYVVDGHHRWAAVTSAAIKAGKPTDMKVRVIDMDAKDIIPMANKFAEEQGVAAKKADANQEGPKSDIASVPKVEDEKGTKAKTPSGKTLYSVGGGYYSDRPNGEPKFIRTETIAKKAFFEGDEKAFLLIFEAEFSADVEGGKTGKFKEIKPEDIKAAEADIQSTQSKSKSYPTSTIQKEYKKLESMDSFLKDADTDTIKRVKILKKNWLKFLNASSKEEKIEALKEMAEYNLIEGHLGGTKIYLSTNTTLPYKHLCGSGNSITTEMNELIKEAGIDVPLRGNAKDRALADMSGKHNEAGVVAYIFPSDENLNLYKETQNTFKELGGDEAKFDKINKKAAEAIKAVLPNGSTITQAQQVGGIGKKALMDLGIDPKVDPTDLIVHYTNASGKKAFIKVSAKTYTDPKNITMKNSGVNNAGLTYLGKIGKSIDSKVAEWRDKYHWDDSMTEDQKKQQKTNLKKAYLSEFSYKMEELSKTPQGQEQLTKMWKSVHGCGKDVYTQIINKNTGEVTIHPPDYYCNPKPPYEIKYDGVKLIINMGGQDNNSIQIDFKTEDKGSPKLLFRHKSK